jgi:hypothetical protein
MTATNAIGCEQGSHMISRLALGLYKGRPVDLVTATLKGHGFPVKEMDGLLVPEEGVMLSVSISSETLTYVWARMPDPED